MNTQQYYLIVFSKWLRFKLGSQAQWIYVLQMVNFPEVNPGANIVILAYVPL